jgi:hypothetical protein
MTKRTPDNDELRARLTASIEELQRQIDEERARRERRRQFVNRLTLGLLPRH